MTYPGMKQDQALLIADLAIAYVAAMKKNEAAEPCDWERARTNVDFAWHRLEEACGYGES